MRRVFHGFLRKQAWPAAASICTTARKKICSRRCSIRKRTCGFTGSIWICLSLKCSIKDRILALFDLLENWFEKEDFFGCVFINAVAEHEKDSAWVKDVAGAYRDQIIERLRALVVESGARIRISLPRNWA